MNQNQGSIQAEALDYKSIDRSYRLLELARHFYTYQAKNKSDLLSLINILGLLIFIVVLLASTFFAFAKTGMDYFVIFILFFIAIIGYQLVGSIYKSIYLRTIRQLKLFNFATDNGFELWLNSSYKINSNEGILFKNQESIALESLILNDGIEIGTIIITRNNSSHNAPEYLYICINLNKKMHHLIVDSKSNNFMGSDSNFLRFDSFDQNLDLEGDFEKYFKLYVPKDYKRETLYIFTPDLMAQLVDNFKDFDIEFINNKVYLYKKGSIDVSNSELLESQLANITDLKRALLNRTKRLKTHKNKVKNSNLKISTKFIIYSAILLFAPFLIAIFMNILKDNNTGLNVYIMYLLILLMFALSFIARYFKLR